MTTGELLARYAELLNEYGEDSTEADQMLREFATESEFVELARTCRKLKCALALPAPRTAYNPSK